MNLSLLTNKQMEMRTNKFMIYVFSAIMLGGMVACSSDDPETDTGTDNGNGGNAELLMYGGLRELLKHVTTCYLMMIKLRMPKVRDRKWRSGVYF